MKPHLPALVLFLLPACGLPRVPVHPFAAPSPAQVPIELCWLETAGTSAPAGFGAAGVTRAARWEATTSALLVRHPAGDILIDAGLSPHAAEEARELSWWGRFVFGQTAGRNVPRADLVALLHAAGVRALRGVILSHAHADHAGGVVALPDVSVWVAPAEARWVEQSLAGGNPALLPAHARALEGRMVPIPFSPQPFANYDQSWDVFGDGTVVVVPAPGHTPGSVLTFVNLGGRRLVHVGDLINLQESIAREVPKSAVMRFLTDEDVAETKRQVARLVELHAQDPALFILPAHDRGAYEAFFGAMPKAGSAPLCVRTGS